MTGCTIRSHKFSSNLKNASVSVQHKQNPTSNPTDIRPWEREDDCALLRERKYCTNVLERTRISKLVRKQLRFHVRQRRNAKLNEIPSEFRDLGRLNVLREEGNSPQVSRLPLMISLTCLRTSLRVRQTSMTHRFTHFDKSLADDSVPVFQLAELLLALQQLRQGKSADPDSLVLEMFPYVGAQLHQSLLDIYNKLLAKNQWDPPWYHTIFTMLPGCGRRHDFHFAWKGSASLSWTRLCGNLRNRSAVECSHRIRIA